MKKWHSYLILIIIPLIFYITPVPDGLSATGWRMSGLFLAAIVGLVLKPFPIPVIFLTIIAVAGLTLGNMGTILRGYSTGTVWTIFSALILCNAILATGLGNRIAYGLIKLFGRTTLGLGYVLAFLDLILAPCTPSTTARSAGIMFSIAKSISESLGSFPEESPRKIGAYLMLNSYLNTKSTAYMFLTASAPNLLIVPFMREILGYEITWMGWFVAGVVPGIVTLLLTPFVIYLLHPPEMKTLDNKRIAQEGFDRIGSMSDKEKYLSVICILALAGWIFGSFIDLDAAVVAVSAFVLILLTNTLTWDDVLKAKGAWNVYIWFGGILGMSSALSQERVFAWIGDLMSQNIEFGGNWTIALALIVFISILSRYFIVSGSAYIVAMIPVFFTLGVVANIPPYPLGLSLAFAAMYGSGVTHYSSAPGPVIFAAEYVSVKVWWTVGAIVTFMTYAINMTLGLWWWSLIGPA